MGLLLTYLRLAACPHGSLSVLTKSSITVEPAGITPSRTTIVLQPPCGACKSLCRSCHLPFHLSSASAMTNGHAQQQRSTEKPIKHFTATGWWTLNK